jgi:hypothetical protein
VGLPRDLALIGIGLRSNYEACHQLMANDWLGTRRLAVVRDDYEQHQVCVLSWHWEDLRAVRFCRSPDARSRHCYFVIIIIIIIIILLYMFADVQKGPESLSSRCLGPQCISPAHKAGWPLRAGSVCCVNSFENKNK